LGRKQPLYRPRFWRYPRCEKTVARLGYSYIAHAFGGILGDTRTNSYEAFLLNYQLGHRIFEIDFTITDDGIPVIVHDIDSWRTGLAENANHDFTYDNFITQ